MKNIVSFLILVCMLFACFVSCNEGTNAPDTEDAGASAVNSKDYETKYNQACSLIEKSKYEEAYKILMLLEDYEPAEKILKHFRYVASSISGIEYFYNEYRGDDRTTFTFTYNENGLPIRVIEKIVGEGDVRIFSYYYSYDGNGNLTKEVYESNDGKKYTYDYTYDSQNHLIKQAITLPGGEKSTNDYTYDSNGNLIQSIYTNQYREESVRTYMYDIDNNLVKESYLSGYGEETVIDYEYDSKGMLIKKIDENGTYNYTYDANGEKIKEVHTNNNGNVWTEEWVYDTSGNKMKYVCTNHYGDIDLIDYTCDIYGNVTKMIMRQGNEVSIAAEASYTLVYIPFEISKEVEEIFEELTIENMVY